MSDQKNIKTRYYSLIKIVNKHNLLYHTYDSPEISDDIYDNYYSELKKIENEYPSIISKNSPTQRVGSELLDSFEKRQHDYPMLSLSNASNENEFRDFYNKLKKNNIKHNEKLFAEPKFDGLAVNITYEDGYYSYATTRGDGFIGEDITVNVRTIKSLPMIIDNVKLPKKFSLRGEIFIDKTDFIKINKDLIKHGLKEYSNPRNLAAGSIRQLDPSIADSRNLRLFVHGISDPKLFSKFKSHETLFSHFNKIGFPVNKYSQTLSSIDECIDYYNKINSIRNEIPYEIDGLVYRVNDFKRYEDLGFTAKSPKWAIAYKFKSFEALTKINNVTFQVGRTGTITPVAELEPVNIGGVNVARATLHNFSEIVSKDIHINDYVYVKRAGDVIPDIDRVETKKRKNVKVIVPPKKCPSCGSFLKREDNQTAYKCLNSKGCIPQIEQAIIHFISRKAMNIQGIGNQTIKELVSKKIISRSSDLYKLSENDFKKLDRVGVKSISNYLHSIESSKRTSFNKFIYSMGIKEVGEASSKSLASKFTSIDEFLNCNFEQLVIIEDVGPIVATNIISFLTDKDNRSNISNLLSSGIEIEYKQKKSTNNLSVVITGTFKNYKRTDLIDLLELKGYKISSSLSIKTNILICGDKPGTKLDKAKDFGTSVVYEDDLTTLL